MVQRTRLIGSQTHKQHFLGEAWLERLWGGELHRVLPLIQFRLQSENKDAASLVTLGNWKCVRVRPGSSGWVWRAELNQHSGSFWVTCPDARHQQPGAAAWLLIP